MHLEEKKHTQGEAEGGEAEGRAQAERAQAETGRSSKDCLGAGPRSPFPEPPERVQPCLHLGAHF